ncbi:hypothetical protein AAMO2058_001638100 [Amorphochlora amoebiformis]
MEHLGRNTEAFAEALWVSLDPGAKGSLTEKELTSAMKSLNPDVEEEKIREFFLKTGCHREGRITRSIFSENFSIFWHAAGPESNGHETVATIPEEDGLDEEDEEDNLSFPAGSPRWEEIQSQQQLDIPSLSRPLSRSGPISSLKFPEYAKNREERIFEWIDANGEGCVSLEEMTKAVDNYLGTTIKESEVQNIKKMMRLQNLETIPKQMFIDILKRIMSRGSQGRKAEFKGYHRISGTLKGSLDDMDTPYDSRRGSNQSFGSITEAFKQGFGISKGSLEEKLTEEMANKEALSKRVRELRKSVVHERIRREKLLTSITKDQEDIKTRNESLTRQNEILSREVENSQAAISSLVSKTSNLEKEEKALREKYNATVEKLGETTKALSSVRADNAYLSTLLLETKKDSRRSLASLRRKSVSKSNLSNEIIRQKQTLEANIRLLRQKNHDLEFQLIKMKDQADEQQRILEATEASLDFWKRQEIVLSDIHLPDDDTVKPNDKKLPSYISELMSLLRSIRAFLEVQFSQVESLALSTGMDPGILSVHKAVALVGIVLAWIVNLLGLHATTSLLFFLLPTLFLIFSHLQKGNKTRESSSNRRSTLFWLLGGKGASFNGRAARAHLALFGVFHSLESICGRRKPLDHSTIYLLIKFILMAISFLNCILKSRMNNTTPIEASILIPQESNGNLFQSMPSISRRSSVTRASTPLEVDINGFGTLGTLGDLGPDEIIIRESFNSAFNESMTSLH